MTREDIIRMAREAGVELTINEHGNQQFRCFVREIERFAVLVAIAEREACAKIIESDPSYDWHKFACEAANAIRARGQA